MPHHRLPRGVCKHNIREKIDHSKSGEVLARTRLVSYGHIYRALKVVLHSVTPLAKTKQHTGTNVVVQRWLDGGKNVPEEQET